MVRIPYQIISLSTWLNSTINHRKTGKVGKIAMHELIYSLTYYFILYFILKNNYLNIK